ncbi:MAG TPA: shikimate dehydrogenase [Candidatus Monoglobus merdigallinarum]|uniref:Shikimate dehydrogenase (NADP(+)) n=1 Tax=Candidatus Monoglobus merdigallinarum TaxID=2838698 RepID=A0A9D1PST8_9FIRM|nr:shikimate dehydrogenase [Candidatus Monoglobus merdigallinarum]
MNKIKLGVIGDPIEHSRSPEVHGMVLNLLGVSYDYKKIRVKKGALKSFIAEAKAEGLTGFNLTMPHKKDIIPLLDEISPEAQLYKSVNTVRIKDGRLCGYNTDAEGFVLALKQNGFTLTDKKTVILGAGGVVSTLALKFALMGAAEITVLNRTAVKAAEICDMIAKAQQRGILSRAVKAAHGALDTENIVKSSKDCDLLINATPLGMSGIEQDFEDLSFFDGIKKDAMAADLIYNPQKTRFLRYAEDKGLKIMNGLGMLIGQAIFADEIYLGRSLDVSEIFTKLMQKHYTK